MFNRKINNRINELKEELRDSYKYINSFKGNIEVLNYIVKQLGYEYIKPGHLFLYGKDFLDDKDLIAHESEFNIYKRKDAKKERKSLPKKGKKGRR